MGSYLSLGISQFFSFSLLSNILVLSIQSFFWSFYSLVLITKMCIYLGLVLFPKTELVWQQESMALCC